jgi:hypothetical protein
MSHNENIVRIKVVHDALEELSSEVVFVGGATVSFYADRPAGEPRPTEDVDILVELLHYKDYAQIEERLRKKGFMNDMESNVICRYKVRGIIVDVMSTRENPLGFTNRWYEKGYRTAMKYSVDKNYTLSIFQPVYFLASKFEAFNNRGQGDGRWSSDFEDIVFVLNNRAAIWSELRKAEGEVADFLKEQFSRLLQNNYADEWISSHLDFTEQRRVRLILGEMEAFIYNEG